MSGGGSNSQIPLGSSPPPEPTAADRVKARRGFLIRITVSAAVVAALLLLLPFGELAGALGRIPAVVWPLAIASYLASHLLGTVKWRMLVNAAGGNLTLGAAVRCYYYGLFGNTFLPSLVGGDVVRAGMALKLSDGRSGVIVGGLMDRAIDILAMAMVAGAGVLLIPTALDDRSRSVFWAAISVVAAGGAVMLVALAAMPARRFSFRLRRILVRGRASLREMTARPRAGVMALLLGIGLQLFLVSLNAGLGVLSGIDVGFTTWLFVWPLAKLSALLPFTQGGIGVREAALAALFVPFGVAAPLAAAAGLAFQAVVLTGGLVGGGLAFGLGRRSPGLSVRPSTDTP